MQAVQRFALVVDSVKIENRTKRHRPCLATPYVKIPIEIEIFVSVDTGKQLLFALNVTLNVSD